MLSLHNYIYKKILSQFFIAWVVILILVLSLHAFSLFSLKSRTVLDQLEISSRVAKSALSSGNWNIASDYLLGISESQKLYGIIIEFDGFKVVGPIGERDSGIFPLCNTYSVEKYQISGCMNLYNIFDLSYLILTLLMVNIFLYFISFLISKKFTFILSKISNDLKLIAGSDFDYSTEKIEEINFLYQRFQFLLKEVEEKAKLESLRDVARQVSHDIKSPFQALKIAMEHAQFSNPKAQKLASGSLERIEKIADDLETGRSVSSNEVHNLSECVQDTLETKKAEYPHVQFSTEITPKILTDIFDKVTISRFISNLVNNSVEAGAKNISTRLRTTKDKIQVNISDDGQGIPASIIENIGKKGFTHGKSSGKGLGLSDLKTQLEFISGKLSITSTEGQGTIIDIEFPLHK